MPILIANLGSHDLQERQPDGQWKPVMKRADAKAIGDRIDSLQPGEIDWPLIRKYLDYCWTRRHRWPNVPNSQSPISRLVLYGTDQPATVDQRFRDGDTIAAAHVIARLVRAAGLVADVRVVPVAVDGVDRHDRMFDFFERALREEDGAADAVVAVTGGTPGANFGLLLAAQAKWGDRTVAIGARAPDRSGDQPAFLLDVTRQIQRRVQEQPVTDLLRDGHFATAARLIRGWKEPALEAVALGAEAIRDWLDLAHDEALILATRANDNLAQHPVGPELTSVLGDLQAAVAHRRQDADAVIAPGLLPDLFDDLYWNADLCLRQERYVDFVGRMALLLERAARAFVEAALGVPVPDNEEGDGQGVDRFWAAVRAGGLDVQRGRLNFATFVEIVGEIKARADTKQTDYRGVMASGAAPVRLTPSERQAQAIYPRLKALTALREVRNRSVIGHRFGAVTEAVVALAVNPGLDNHYRPTPETAAQTRGTRGVQRAIAEILKYLVRAPAASNPFLALGDRLAAALLASDATR